MTDGQAALDRIFPLQDVNVGSTDCSRRDPDKCVQRTYIRDRLLIENNTSGFDKHRCFHFHHRGPLFNVSFSCPHLSAGVLIWLMAATVSSIAATTRP